jgi:hypothetical protein
LNEIKGKKIFSHFLLFEDNNDEQRGDDDDEFNKQKCGERNNNFFFLHPSLSAFASHTVDERVREAVMEVVLKEDDEKNRLRRQKQIN